MNEKEQAPADMPISWNHTEFQVCFLNSLWTNLDAERRLASNIGSRLRQDANFLGCNNAVIFSDSSCKEHSSAHSSVFPLTNVEYITDALSISARRGKDR